MQPLDRPAVLHEAARQIVEQLGMGRRFAQIAELARRIHQTATEVVLPHAIDDHAGGERRGVFHDRLREFETAAAGGEPARQAGLRRKGREEAARHGGPQIVRIAALHELQITRHAHLVVELCAVLLFLLHDEQRGLLDGVRHFHVVMRSGGLQCGNLGLEGLRLLGEILRLLFLQVGDPLFQRRDLVARLFHRLPEIVPHDRHLGELHGGENAGECVVVLRRDRVGLVIVAACTG